MKLRIITVTILSIVLITTLIAFDKYFKRPITLNPLDSRNRMDFDTQVILIPEKTGALPETSSDLIRGDSSQNEKLLKQLPIQTEYFTITAGANNTILVTTMGTNYKPNLLEFYSWLEREGYDKIDMSQVKVNSDK